MKVKANGTTFNCEISGRDGAPWVMFSNSLATNYALWNGQAASLASDFRVLRYDQRGHGGTEAVPGPYTFDALADDARALMAALGVERCHFVGLSMGGMTALGLALNHAEVIDSITVCNSLSRVPGPDWIPLFKRRIETAETQGLEPLVEPTIERWFTAAFRAKAPSVLDDVRAMIRQTDPVGYVGCSHALTKINYYPRLGEIEVPTLLIAGAQDVATPPDGMRAMEDKIAGARYVELDPAAHLSNLEQPGAFNAALCGFLAEQIS